MEEIKCKQCGSTNITREGWFYVCQNCKAKYSLDASGIESKKLENLIDAGCTALDNEDYHNAKSFFKSALEINPHNGTIYHYYNFSADLDLLSKKSAKNVEILANGLKGKMGTILDMYHNISNKEIRNDCLEEAIEDFDFLCRQIAIEIFSNNYNRDGLYTINDAYHSSIDKLVENGEDESIVQKLMDFDSDFSQRINKILDDEDNASMNNTDYSGFNTTRMGRKGYKAVNKFARFFAFSFDIETIIKFLLVIGSVAFLFLMVIGITKGWGWWILFYGLSMGACMYGAYQVFDFDDELPVFFRTLLWIALFFFVIFDFGTGLWTGWRIAIGLILFGFSYKIFDNII